MCQTTINRLPIRFAVVLFCWAAVAIIVVAGSDTDDDTSELPDRMLSALFDVGRLWLRATVEQWDRFAAAASSMASHATGNPWSSLVALVVSVSLCYVLYKLLMVPLNRVRLLGDIGYIADGRMSTKDTVEIVKKRRAVGDVPPVYPNGWFAICESRDLRIGQAKTVSCLGKNLAVFRGEDGHARAIDAYCPHMGADLAAGGIVKGNCLECPFHGWLFRGDDGKCVHIPYCDRKSIPEVAKVHSYSTLERNGLVMFWYHAEGLDPQWMPPEIEEISRGDWTYRGRSEHTINAHIEEIPENGADVAHLAQVHGPIMTAGVDLRYTYSKWWSFAHHDWSGQWNQHTDPDQAHVGVLSLLHRIKLFGYFFPILDLKVEARQIGPGLVHMLYESALFGRGCFLQTLTPVEPLTQRMVHNVYSTRWLPTVISKFFLYAEALMVERDLMIWNNKRYVSKPVFVKSKEDALIQRHRRWYSQFYTEHSPRLKATSDLEDW